MRGTYRAILLLLGAILLSGLDALPALAVPQPNAAPMPELEGAYVFPYSEWKALNGAELATAPPYVLSKGGQEISLRIHDIKAGLYYLRANVETGSATG